VASAGVLLDGLPHGHLVRAPLLLLLGVHGPTSTVPSEQVFSTAGDILTDKRSRLSTDNAEKLLILEENLLKFSTGCDIEQCEFDGLVKTSLSRMTDD